MYVNPLQWIGLFVQVYRSDIPLDKICTNKYLSIQLMKRKLHIPADVLISTVITVRLSFHSAIIEEMRIRLPAHLSKTKAG